MAAEATERGPGMDPTTAETIGTNGSQGSNVVFVMRQQVTPYLARVAETSAAVRMQYYTDPLEYSVNQTLETDPLQEDTYEKEAVKGLVHKFTNRALIKTSHRCVAHCRFCTRYRQIGNSEGDLSAGDIANIVSYLQQHTEIDDVILSGGDPFATPKAALPLLRQIKDIPSVDVMRVGTRLPVHNPLAFCKPQIQEMVEVIAEAAQEKNFYILINFQHPDELTPETLGVVRKLRMIPGVTLLSQTVFLKGINNSTETLTELFKKLYRSGIQPYYLYRCDYARGVERFICDMEEEIRIASELRSTLSGIGCPQYIVDVPGYGKIPVPLNYWGADVSHCRDFKGQEIQL